MSDVDFTEENVVSSPRPKEARGLYKLAIRMGLAKSEEGARIVLIIIAAIAIVSAVAIPIFFG